MWKNHKSFCKRVATPTNSPSKNNSQQTCVIIDGLGPIASGWDDMLGARRHLLPDGGVLDVIHIDGSKGGASISVQVASLLKSNTPP